MFNDFEAVDNLKRFLQKMTDILGKKHYHRNKS